MSTDLLKRVTVVEMCDAYAQTVAQVTSGVRSISAARERMRGIVDRFEVFPGNSHEINLGQPDDLIAKTVDRMHRSTWAELIARSNVRPVMIPARQKELDHALERGELPPIEPDAVMAFLNGLRGELPRIISEAIVEAARVLRPTNRHYATNGDGWQLGKKAIIEWVVKYEYGGWSLSYHRDRELLAIDNAFHLLDGRGVPEYQDRLEAHIRAAMHEKPVARTTCETPYFRAKWFKAGTLHLEFKRQDLVDELNYAAADHTTLRDESVAGERVSRSTVSAPPAPPSAEVIAGFTDDDRRRVLGFFETPEPLAWQLVELANVHAGMRILEPSAGRGAIVRAVVQAAPCCHIDCIDVDQQLLATTYRWGVATTTTGDFLNMAPRDDYDRVIANPPFGDGRDVAHVRRMFEWLAPGGRLVSVMAAGVMFRQDRRHTEFRAWLEAAGGTIEPLPAESFKSSGTSVATCVVVIDKQAAIAAGSEAA